MRPEFLPFSPPSIDEAEIAEVVDTLRSDWITTGPKVQRFESEFASAVQAPGALAVSSCTAGLEVALAAIGVGPGDAVFTSTMTFAATVNVIEHRGATPILVDVDPETLNLDPAALERALSSLPDGLRARAVMPVHHSGHPCDMDRIGELVAAHRLAVVEDAAHALPAAWRGTPIGAIPTRSDEHAVAFSFYATKNLTTAEGGMLTASPALLDEARLWSLHGMSRDAWKRYGKGGSWFYEVVRPGFKCNMTDVQAAMGIHQLQRLDSMHRRRQEIAARYRKLLGDTSSIVLPVERPEVTHAWHLFVIRLQLDRLTIGRDQFIDELTARNIGASVHFIPVHMHPWYRDRYGFEPQSFPSALHEFERMISLPLHTRLTDRDVDDVASAVVDIISRHSR